MPAQKTLRTRVKADFADLEEVHTLSLLFREEGPRHPPRSPPKKPPPHNPQTCQDQDAPTAQADGAQEASCKGAEEKDKR